MYILDDEVHIKNGKLETTLYEVNDGSLDVYTDKRFRGKEITDYHLEGNRLRVYGDDKPLYVSYETYETPEDIGNMDITGGLIAQVDGHVFVEERIVRLILKKISKLKEGDGLTPSEIKELKVDSAVNSDTTNGYVLNKDVPSNAIFTDTIVDITDKADISYVTNRVKTPVPINAIFTDTITDISGKVDKESGKGLSTNDFTNSDKKKLNEGAADSVSKAYVDNRVKTPVPLNAVFTDTVYDDTKLKDGVKDLRVDVEELKLHEAIKVSKEYQDGFWLDISKEGE